MSSPIDFIGTVHMSKVKHVLAELGPHAARLLVLASPESSESSRTGLFQYFKKKPQHLQVQVLEHKNRKKMGRF